MRQLPELAVKEIKQSFRQYMDGVIAQSLRDKGLKYKIIWGVSQLHLREMAREYEPDAELAKLLWESDVRECKLLATMLMPKAEFKADEAEKWMSEVKNQELAEMLCFNLLQHCEFSATLAHKWITSDDELKQIAGYNLIARLLSSAAEPKSLGVRQAIENVKNKLALFKDNGSYDK